MNMRVAVVVFALMSSCAIEFVSVSGITDRSARLRLLVITHDSTDLQVRANGNLQLGSNEAGDLLTVANKGLTIFDSTVAPSTEEVWGELTYRFSQTRRDIKTGDISPPTVLELGPPPVLHVPLLAKKTRDDLLWSAEDDLVLELQPSDSANFRDAAWILDVKNSDGRRYLQIRRDGFPPDRIAIPSSLLVSAGNSPVTLVLQTELASTFENPGKDYLAHMTVHAEIFWTVQTSN